MEYDEILKNYIGEIGVYQILIVLYVSSVSILGTFNAIDFTLIGYTPNFRCNVGNVSHLQNQLSFNELLHLTSPISASRAGEHDACLVYDRNFSTLSLEDSRKILQPEENVTLLDDVFDVRKCEEWVYDTDVFTSTIVSEWDLVCDKSMLLATTQSIFSCGLFTAFIGGFLADRYGRKPVSLICILLHFFARIAEGLAPNLVMFMVVRFCQGLININFYMSIFTIAVELVGPKWRVLFGQIPYIMWSVGYMILPGMAFLIRDWRKLTLVLAVFSVPFVFLPCVMPESIRWLISQNKHEEAATIMKRMAKFNKREIPDHVLRKVESKNHSLKKNKFKDLFKSKELVKTTLTLFFLWISASVGYYGIVYFLTTLGGNIFVTTFISGALEIPSLIYVYLALDTKLGRRINTIITFGTCGVSMLILMAIPKEQTWIILSFALIGRVMIAAGFSILKMYTTEIYPTFCRTIGLSACMTVTRIGMVAAPYMAALNSVSPYLPPSIFGTFTLMSAVLAWFLTETRGTSLPEDINQLSGRKTSPDSKEMKTKTIYSDMNANKPMLDEINKASNA